MRIAPVKSWLLAALTLANPVSSQTGPQSDPFLMFQSNPGFTKDGAGGPAFIDVITRDEGKTFIWVSKNEVKVQSVELFVRIEANGSRGTMTPMDRSIGSFNFPNNKLKFPRDDVVPTTPVNDHYPIIGLTGNSDVGSGTVTILNLTQVIDSPLPGKSLFFEAKWSHDGKSGKSYSRWFTAISTTTSQPIKDHVYANQLFIKDEKPYDEEFPVKDAPYADIGAPTRTPSTIPTSPATTTDNTSDNTGQNTSGPEESPKPKGKGLSMGAIVGIAIACGLIGLALIGGIVFFCLRRRQKQNALGGGTSRGVPYGGFSRGGGRNGGDELMAEKEANAGVIHDVTSAPNSPYSDDGNHQRRLMGMGDIGAGTSSRNSGSVIIPSAGSGIAPHAVLPGVDSRLDGDGGGPVSNAPSHHMQQHDHQSGRSYTMYSDHQSTGGGGGSPTTLHSGTGGAQSLTHKGAGTESNRGSLISQQQQGRSSSTPYAHLIEEGMTEEQIRTLEEEERQLDAAIEQHVGGQRGSRNL